MKLISCLIFIIFLSGCSKPKTILICGDHECVNKEEANQYFEENLTLEVKIIDQNKKQEIDLVELNLRNNDKEKKVGVIKKKVTNKKLKILSNKEKKDIKNKIKQKNKKKDMKILKKIDKNKIDKKKTKKKYLKQAKLTNNEKKTHKDTNNAKKEIEDICSLVKVCNIDEISKYLLEIGKKKDYPDITKRQ